MNLSYTVVWRLLSTLFVIFFVTIKVVFSQTIVPDSNFAKAIRTACPDCIDSANTLLPVAANLKILTVSNKSIRNLAGLEGFAGLEQLDCNSNQLTSLPELPIKLDLLICYNNKIGRLPRLPESLRLLNCSNNELDTIPPLPPSLLRLICINNKLKVLPENLPTTLELIECSRNQITQLPKIHHIPYLRFLYCSGNQLKKLPLLFTLYCANNQLKSLPQLPYTLRELDFSNNQVSSLGNLPNLNFLSCSGNQLRVLPELPLLHTLHCANNQLKSLPQLPYTLSDLDCSNNQISSLEKLPTSITLLNLSSNELTCLPTIPFESLIAISIDAEKIKCFPNEVGTAQVLNSEGQRISTSPVCQENLKHTAVSLVSGTYVATKKIESAAILLEGTTKYHTTQSITLTPGFSTAATTTFVAELRTCN